MKLQEGFVEAVVGIVASIVINSILFAFAEDGLIPSYWVILFTIAGFLGAIALFFRFKATGFIFTLGWIAGAVLLRDLLGPVEFVVYLVVPIAALVVGVVMAVKGST